MIILRTTILQNITASTAANTADNCKEYNDNFKNMMILRISIIQNITAGIAAKTVDDCRKVNQGQLLTTYHILKKKLH